MTDQLVTPSPVREVLAGWFVVLLLAAALALGSLALGERKQAAVGPELLPPTHWTLHARGTLHARAATPPLDDETAAEMEAKAEQETYRTAGSGAGSGIIERPPMAEITAALAK
jgi:hypothetical protein